MHFVSVRELERRDAFGIGGGCRAIALVVGQRREREERERLVAVAFAGQEVAVVGAAEFPDEPYPGAPVLGELVELVGVDLVPQVDGDHCMAPFVGVTDDPLASASRGRRTPPLAAYRRLMPDDPDASPSEPAQKPREVPPLFGAYLAIGIGMGTAIGVAIDNIALGIGIGVAFGVAMGFVVDRARTRPGATPPPQDDDDSEA